MDMKCVWSSDFELAINFHMSAMTITAVLKHFWFSSDVRLRMCSHKTLPNSSMISFSFPSKPYVDFVLEPLPGLDLITLPGLSQWIKEKMFQIMKDTIVWPQQLIVP